MRNKIFPELSSVISTKGMAATSHPLSTLEAISILKKGGNAVDSAIAASAVQAVVEPGATGVGGDCFALIAIKGKKPVSINGSGINPKKASLDFFYKNKINKIELTSPHSVTIPGAVHAWYTMHQKFGKLDFKEFHPSGTLNAKLKTAGDLMVTGKKIPFANENLKMKSALKIISNKKLGVLLISNKRGLTNGICTDADVKRAIEKYKDIKNLPVKKIMTRKPIGVDQDTLAAKCLLIMNEKKITSLVINSKNSKRKAIGLLHVHMILEANIQ